MASLSDRIKALVGRVIRWSVIEGSTDDTTAFPIQQVSYLGRSGKSAAWYPYGFHARAKAGDLALLFGVGGDSASRLHLPGSPKDRPEIEEGEVVLYHPDTGSKVYLKKDGTIDIVSAVKINQVAPNVEIEASTLITLDTPTVLATGAAAVIGATTLLGDFRQAGAKAGFFGTTPITKPTVTGNRSGGTALTNLLIELDRLGIITDST